MVKRTITLTLVTMLLASVAFGEIRLPAIIASDMVLQRKTEVTLWGWSDQKKVTVSTSWLANPTEVKVSKEGKWLVKLSTTDSREAQRIKISDANSNVELNNVLFGEVWLCSGQSNMDRAMKGGIGEPTFGGAQAIAKANNPNLRLFFVKRAPAKTPASDLVQDNTWASANPNSVANFSAVAYFFGTQLQEALGVPVGLIHAAWGGTDVRSWMSNEVLNEYEAFSPEEIVLDGSWQDGRNFTSLFNGMIHPLIPYAMRGALWYQGEANRNWPEAYEKLLPAMVRDWRDRWNVGEFPFYYVQIAPYNYGDPEAYEKPKNSAYMRESQLNCVDLIPNSGMAVTLDLGESFTIHPPKKKEIGDRLFYLAMNKTYGFETVDFSGPVYASHEVKGDSMMLKFDHAEQGLYASEGLTDFTIAGENQVFYPAQASIIDKRYVLVRSKDVPEPVAVRYGWSNWVRGSLFDTHLLPASSFRTDTWENATRFKSER